MMVMMAVEVLVTVVVIAIVVELGPSLVIGCELSSWSGWTSQEVPDGLFTQKKRLVSCQRKSFIVHGDKLELLSYLVPEIVLLA